MSLLEKPTNIISFFLIILFISLPVVIKADDKLGVYEQLDQSIREGQIFIDDKFQPTDIRQAITKPTIIAMVYYECPGICTPLMNGLADVMKKSDLELGKDYEVFTISFSHTEKTILAQNKKKTYEKLVGKGDTDKSWRFFTGDSVTIQGFLDNIGYQVKQEGAEFIHPATLVVVSPQGKITRYLHGTYFLPFDMKMAVVEAGMGKSSPTINKVLKFCFSYDADGQRYVLNITKISGTIILIMALGLFTYLFVSNRRKNQTNNA